MGRRECGDMGKGRQAFPTTPRATTTGPSHTHLTHAQHTQHAPEPHHTWHGGLRGSREGGGWVWGAARPHETCQPAPYLATRPPQGARRLHRLRPPAGLQMGNPPHTPPCLVIRRPWPEFEPRNPLACVDGDFIVLFHFHSG